ncbi:MAG: DUF4390 domain-containing protein [Acidobacteriota bacterium]
MIVLTVAVPARSEQARIDQLQAKARNGMVSLSFQLANAFDYEEIRKALTSGLATGFTYHIELVRSRPNWFDDTIASSRIEIICTYNSVTQEYLLNYRHDRKLVRSEVYRDLNALQKAMTSVSEADFFSLGRYRPSKLIVRVRADVMQGYFLYVMPWQVSTDWSHVRVALPKAGE